VTDVSADQHPMPSCLEHPPDQRGGRRLAFGAGDRDDAPLKPARGQLQLTDDGNAGRAGGGDLRLRRRHSGTQHDQVRLLQCRRSMSTELE
jgi:hypothetical protein